MTQSRWPQHAFQGWDFDVGEYEVHLRSSLTLFPGSYSLLAGAHRTDGLTIDWVERSLDFEILNAAVDSPLHHPWRVRGFMQPNDRWSEPVPVTYAQT